MSDTPPPPPPPQSPYEQSPALSPNDEKLWATLVHIGGIFFSFLPALIGYLILKDKGPFVRAHTATALNFQISIAIYGVALWILGTVLLFVVIGVVFYFALIALWAVNIIFSIMAAVKANQGLPYTYPLSIKFVS